MNSLVFCQFRAKPYLGVDTSGFLILDALPVTIRHSLLLLRHFGPLGYLIQLVKSLNHRRILYLIQCHGKVVTSGTISVVFSNSYQVTPSAAVIGSIRTEECHRNQGLACIGIRAVVNYMLERGNRTFYIDVQEGNLPMLKAIENTDFGEPVGHFYQKTRYPSWI